MWAGIEVDLIPTQPGSTASPKSQKRRKDPKVWLAGELIVRCEHQGVDSLPAQLFLKTKLRKLILTGNALTYVPHEIGLLKELRELKLGHNQLQELPDDLVALQYLEYLDVQRNQLDTVPACLCRLIYLTVLNLDGNPLHSSVSAEGPPLCELWAAPTAVMDTSTEAAAGRTPQPSGRQAAAATLQRLRQSTEAVLQHLMQQQDPQAAMDIKQAKLKLLQEASSQRINKLITVADPDSLDACLHIASSTGLDSNVVERIRQSRAATEAMQQALQQAQAAQQQAGAGSSSPAGSQVARQLAAAIKQFEKLCKPGKPDGPVYLQAHALWRKLQRQQLERGWRCNSPASPRLARTECPGTAVAPYMVDEDALGPDSQSSPPRRRFLTLSERRRQELEAAGAQSYIEWYQNKQDAAAKERHYLQEAARQLANDKESQLHERAARAVDNCSREKAWSSKIVESYPAGTFSRSPKQLIAIKKHYQRPPLDDSGPEQ